MQTLYSTAQNIKIVKKNISIQILDKNGYIKSSEKLHNLSSIILFGNNIDLDANLASELLINNVTVTWLSDTGKFIGRLEPTHNIDFKNHIKQFKFLECQSSINYARNLVQQKITNSHKLFNSPETNFSNIESLNKATDIKTVRKIHDEYTKIYYDQLSSLLPTEFKFNGRSKQPPLDPFNSMLSLGYTLLIYEVYSHLLNLDLQPYRGYLNENRKGSPSLAIDLIEKWRHAIIDSLCLEMIAKNQLNRSDFTLPNEVNSGVNLQAKALEIFITAYENKLSKLILFDKNENSKTTYRELLNKECLNFKELIDNIKT